MAKQLIDNKCNIHHSQISSQTSLEKELKEDEKASLIKVIYAGHVDNCPYLNQFAIMPYVIITVSKWTYEEGIVGDDNIWRHKNHILVTK